AVLSNNADGTDLHPGVKAHVFDATRRWMDPNGDGDPSDGIDGWRLDVADEVPNGFWRDWNALVREINPEAVTIAEKWSDTSEYLVETGFHSAMNYHALAIPLDAWAFDARTDASTFADEATERFAAFEDATRPALMNVIASHDTDRLASMIVNGPLGANFDRLAGPRDTTAYLVRAPNAEERQMQRAIVLFQMAMPGAPHVYYGDEAGMWGGDDPDDRKPMVWPDSTYEPESHAPRGLSRDPDPVAFDAILFAFYQRAIAMRRSDLVLRRGDLTTLAASGRALAFVREHGGERRVVALNAGDTPAFLPMPGTPDPLTPVMASRPGVDVPGLMVIVEEDRAIYGLRVPPRTAVVYRPASPDDVRPGGLDE
ncbi:MAG: alpha-amylase family glycosyl hydrolase, partial [Bacteroidota bacterium]